MGMENLMVVAFERVFGFCHQQEKNISWIKKIQEIYLETNYH